MVDLELRRFASAPKRRWRRGVLMSGAVADFGSDVWKGVGSGQAAIELFGQENGRRLDPLHLPTLC